MGDPHAALRDPAVVPEYVVMEGPKFRKLVVREDGVVDGAAFNKVWTSLRVLARCSPTDKYVLVKAVRALQQGGAREVVAMTGEAGCWGPAYNLH